MDAQAFLSNMLERIADLPVSCVDELVPWNVARQIERDIAAACDLTAASCGIANTVQTARLLYGGIAATWPLAVGFGVLG